MVRSLYAGVTGMKAHQTRMDVIGNNVANVNTFGFKSSRATFRDVYYQSMRGAAGGSGTKGGLNPSQIGYGSTIGSVDVNQTQSINSSTGNPLDISIGGEGFLQVQDPDGNIYYTRAGMLNIDDYGNLIDSNGNFVLGTSGSPLGKAPGSNRIQFSVPAVNPQPGSGGITVNGVQYTLKASNSSPSSNVTVNFIMDDMPASQRVDATVNSSDITVKINKSEVFTSMAQLMQEVNNAITAANGGKEHPAGTFSLSADPAPAWPAEGLTGEEIVSANTFAKQKGDVPLPAGWLTDGFDFVTTGAGFSGKADPPAPANFTFADITTAPITDKTIHKYEVTVEVGGVAYKGTITGDQMKNGGKQLLLTGESGKPGDTITIKCPSEEYMKGKADNGTATDAAFTFDQRYTGIVGDGNIKEQIQSTNVGLGAQPFSLKNGTEGGPQTVGDLSSIKIGADGVVKATHPILGDLEIGRIDLAMFDNAAGLEQVGSTYFAKTDNSGDAKLSAPGTNGTGALASSFLEMSNVDLSQEFADMITTQRGFQANSRLITVSDTMLEELINLKR